MENRFGLKDLILFVLIAVLMVLMVLGMKQYDRQWNVVQQVQMQLNDQTNDLARIRRLLEQGHYSSGGAAVAQNLDVDVRARKIQSAPDFATGDSVIDVFGVIPDKLTPLISTDLYSSYVQGYVLDTLIDRDPITLGWIPRLAKSWKISDDGLRIDFTLRPGVTFSDGTPLTVDDVIFTMELSQNEKTEDPRVKAYLDKLKKVEKISDDTVRYTFTEPYFMAFEVAGSTQVMSRKFYSQYTPEQFNNSTGLLLGSGPYRLPDPRNWRPEPGKPIELVRNERYWGAPGGPDRLVWRLIDLPAARMTALRNGEIDVFYQPNPEQFNEIKKDPVLSKKVNTLAMQTLTAGYMYIGWNEKRGGEPTFFSDRRVRTAMTMLIDREAIIRDIMRGYASVCTGPFSSQSPQSDPSVKAFPFDPDGAAKLLAEAGFVRRNNVLVDSAGKEFAFDFLYNSTSEASKRVATYVQDALARAGIVMHPIASEWSIMLQKTKERNYDAVFMGWGGTVEDDPEQIFTSSAMEGVGDNFVQYSNPKLDAVIEKARMTPNEQARRLLWHEVHRIIHADQPYTFMFADMELDAVDKRFKGVEPTKVGIAGLKNEWYVPKALQKYRD